MDKFKGKYRISSARHPNWDYSSAGPYFVTICTKNREHYFGEIVEKKNNAFPGMQLTKIGEIANHYWLDIPNHFPFVLLDEFVFMPNHVHGILIFNDVQHVETQNFASLQPPSKPPQQLQWKPNKFGPQSKNLASVIRGFKSAVKTYSTTFDIDFAWQPRYHDRIIRNQDEFDRIKKYILVNPLNWNEDEYNN